MAGRGAAGCRIRKAAARESLRPGQGKREYTRPASDSTERTILVDRAWKAVRAQHKRSDEKVLQAFNMGESVGSCGIRGKILSDFTVRTEANAGWNPKEHRSSRWNPGWVSTGGAGSAQHWGPRSVGVSTYNFVMSEKLRRVKEGPWVPVESLSEPLPQTCPEAPFMKLCS